MHRIGAGFLYDFNGLGLAIEVLSQPYSARRVAVSQESKMDHAQPEKMTLRVAPDVRRQLEDWAAHNVSTMTAEVNRSVRYRAEQQEKAGAN